MDPSLPNRLARALGDPDVAAEAACHSQRCQKLGLVSDWHACRDKVTDFARLVVAAERILPPGGSIETGVYMGGTTGHLVLAASPGSFCVSVDPYGLASQSYRELLDTYGDWPVMRATMVRLTKLGEEAEVTFSHYLMDSLTFIQADLLRHPVAFRIVHLDDDHSAETVAAELSYFRRHISGPALFILDDHDDNFPGVEEGLRAMGDGLVRVLHNYYDFPGVEQPCGFSAWLHPGH